MLPFDIFIGQGDPSGTFEMSDPTPGTSAAPSVDCGPTTRFSNHSNPAPPPRSKPIKPDHTLLKPPITTSITGLKQAIFALENSTPEVTFFS